MSINERTKQLRKALKMTQTDFGTRCCISQTHLASIETGKRSLTDAMTKLICAEFNVNEQWLRTGEGDMFIQNDATMIDELVHQYGLDELDKKILSRYIELPEQSRKVLKEYLFSLASSVSSQPSPVSIPTDPIEDELESYRKELEAERMGSTSSHSAG